MPLEISEAFSMAPLSRGGHSTEYTIPKDFDMGVGDALKIQQQLVSQFEELHSLTNTFLDANGLVSHFGLDAFKPTLDRSKARIRKTRDKLVELMVDLYRLGQEPLPPQESVDKDVAWILDDTLLIPAARELSGIVAEAESSTGTQAVAADLQGVDWTMRCSAIRAEIAKREKAALRKKSVKDKSAISDKPVQKRDLPPTAPPVIKKVSAPAPESAPSALPVESQDKVDASFNALRKKSVKDKSAISDKPVQKRDLPPTAPPVIKKVSAPAPESAPSALPVESQDKVDASFNALRKKSVKDKSAISDKPVQKRDLPPTAPPVIKKVSAPAPESAPSALPVESQDKVDASLLSLLESLDLEKYLINFQAEEVDMKALVYMTEDDMKSLGIPMGPRKKILAALAHIKRKSKKPSSTSTS